MFVAMNHFTVMPKREADFEQIWQTRETYLQSVPGFVHFMLLRGDQVGEYISHSTWESREAFLDWTRSESFVKGHQQESLRGILAGPPQVRTYDAVLHETPTDRAVDDSVPAADRQPIAPRH